MSRLKIACQVLLALVMLSAVATLVSNNFSTYDEDRYWSRWEQASSAAQRDEREYRIDKQNKDATVGLIFAGSILVLSSRKSSEGAK